MICALSRTPTAAKVRKALIDVFLAYRRGDLPPAQKPEAVPPVEKPVAVRAHRRSLPGQREVGATLRADLVSFVRAFRDAPEELADWIATNLEALDQVRDSLRGVRGRRDSTT